MNEINKPITILRVEFANKMIELINGSQLPYFVIEDILQTLSKEVGNLAKQQLENDIKSYQEALVKAKKAQEALIETENEQESSVEE